MAIWQDYQESAAALFRSVGLEATTDERLDGVRGAHDVDVVVRSRLAGLEQLWVVECKWRRRRVEKLHVTALAEIVRDVGADRGVLLSEVGFQAGAVRMAHKSNVTLTSLAELREEAAEELLMVRLGECRLRLAHLRERLGTVGRVRRHGGTALSVSYRETQGRWGFVKLHAAVSIAEEGLRRAEMGRWPAPYAWDFASDGTRRARDPAAFIDGLTAALDELEAELAAFEAANA
ncbi:restriction endonuclease [Ornithinimicrobium panacihumi]|uniref:restriction endonuclease n=1 Tax=Ornithinimicrobium panacihumi TaxID=2008449 RepID=UPI003F8A5FE9